MSKNTEKKSLNWLWITLISIVVACMVFPSGVFYRSATEESITITGLHAVFGGQFLDSIHKETVFNIVPFLGFFLPIIGATLYIATSKFKWGAIFPIVTFLASLILLFCATNSFCAVNGILSRTNYSIGVGTVLGAIFSIIGLITSIVIGVKKLLA